MSEPARILVVDDERHLADGIGEILGGAGYAATVVYDSAEGLRRASEDPFDLVLLDVMMPRMDGLELCERMRRSGLQTPVMFLTVKDAPEDRVRGLRVGGDDYLVKPFHLQELLLRVAAILRRMAWYTRTQATLAFGGNTVDFRTYQARSWDGGEHSLTYKEAMILKLLAERGGAVVQREDILETVWGYEVYPSTRTIDNFVVRLRKRFERSPEAPEHIHTVHGVGYRFSSDPEKAGHD